MDDPARVSLADFGHQAQCLTWIAVAAGANHGIAIRADGSLWTWGYIGPGLDVVPGHADGVPGQQPLELDHVVDGQ